MLNKILNSPIAMTYMAYFVTFGSGVLILPLILLKFNSVEISIWFLISTLMSLAALADTGFGATLIRSTSYFFNGASDLPKNLEDFKNKKQNSSNINQGGLTDLIQTANILYLLISFLSSILLYSVGISILDNLIKMSETPSELWLAFYIVILNIFIRMQTVKNNSLLQGFNLVAKQKKIETFTGFVRLILFFIILTFGYNIFELVLADLIMTISAFIITRYKTKQVIEKYNIENYKIFKYHSEIIKSIFPSSWRFGLIQWGGYFINYGTSIIVSQLPDPKIIASFLVTQRIVFIIRQLSQVPIYSNLPVIYKMMSGHKFDELKDFTVKYIRFGIVIMIILLLSVGLLGNIILNFLNIEARLVDNEIFFIMSVAIILEYHHASHSQIYMGSNHVPFLIPSLVSASLILIIGFSIVEVYGLIGLVLTQFFVQLSINNWYPVYLNLKLLDWKFGDYMKSLILVK